MSSPLSLSHASHVTDRTDKTHKTDVPTLHDYVVWNKNTYGSAVHIPFQVLAVLVLLVGVLIPCGIEYLILAYLKKKHKRGLYVRY